MLGCCVARRPAADAVLGRSVSSSSLRTFAQVAASSPSGGGAGRAGPAGRSLSQSSSSASTGAGTAGAEVRALPPAPPFTRPRNEEIVLDRASEECASGASASSAPRAAIGKAEAAAAASGTSVSLLRLCRRAPSMLRAADRGRRQAHTSAVGLGVSQRELAAAAAAAAADRSRDGMRGVGYAQGLARPAGRHAQCRVQDFVPLLDGGHGVVEPRDARLHGSGPRGRLNQHARQGRRHGPHAPARPPTRSGGAGWALRMRRRRRCANAPRQQDLFASFGATGDAAAWRPTRAGCSPFESTASESRAAPGTVPGQARADAGGQNA